MSETKLNILFNAIDKASSVAGRVSGALGRVQRAARNAAVNGARVMNDNFNRTASILQTGLTAGLFGAAGLLGTVGWKSVQTAGQFEVYRATLTSMLGTQELANQRLKEYADIGAKTPFELDQVVNLGNSLQAVGRYSRENVIMLGDLAAAAGKPIEQVSGAFAKLASGQKGVAVDMFRDLLISTDDWVKATGKGIDKSGSLMASTEEMMAALPKILDAKGFSGMMDEQSKTLFGKWSNLMDAMSEKFRVFGEKLLPIIKPYIDAAIDFVGAIDIDEILHFAEHIYILIDSLVRGKPIFEDTMGVVMDLIRAFGIPVTFEQVDTFIRKMQDILNQGPVVEAMLVGLAVVIGTLVVGALYTMAAAVLAATWPLLLIGAAAAALYYAWETNFLGIRDIWAQVWAALEPSLMRLKDSFTLLIEELTALWNYIQPYVMPTLEFLAYILGAVVVGAIWLLINAINIIVRWWTFLVGAMRGAISAGERMRSWSARVGGSLRAGIGSALQWLANKAQAVRNAINAVTNAGNNIRNAGSGFVNRFRFRLPSFRSGTSDFVGGVAKVHQGETIIPMSPGTKVLTRNETAALAGVRKDEPKNEVHIHLEGATIVADDASQDKFTRDFIIPSLQRAGFNT